MTLHCPRLIDTSKKLIASVPFNFNYTDPITGVTLTRKASTLFISSDELKLNGDWTNITVDTYFPSEKQLLDFVGMQSLIKACADNAEDIKNRFLNINLSISSNPKIDRLEIMRMDLMKLKDRFMEFLKRDQLIKTVDEYSSNQKLKPFRKNLDTFITDRNIYTHGQLHLLRPNFDFVIEYIHNHTKEKVYAYISKEVLISYNSFYIEILKLITAFHETRKF